MRAINSCDQPEQALEIATDWANRLQSRVPHTWDWLKSYIRVAMKHQYTRVINMPWDNTAPCARYGYKSDVLGMIAEWVAHCCAMVWFSSNQTYYQDEYNQKTLGRDFYANGTHQVKTVQFVGSFLTLNREWLQGDADYIWLIDFDDNVLFVLSRPVLSNLCKETYLVDVTMLTELSTYYTIDLNDEIKVLCNI